MQDAMLWISIQTNAMQIDQLKKIYIIFASALYHESGQSDVKATYKRLGLYSNLHSKINNKGGGLLKAEQQSLILLSVFYCETFSGVRC